MTITTAVFPVAGFGTRFLPVTKAGPKEMLPIIDKPLIQFAVEEAIQAGFTQLVFITSSGKRAIEDYFDSNYELENYLKARGDYAQWQRLRHLIPSQINFVYVRQPEPRGLGDAVLRARHVVGDNPFAVVLADDVIDCGARGCLQQMMQQYRQCRGSVLAIDQVPHQQTASYGMVSMAPSDQEPNRIETIVEKPTPEQAPSNLAVIGRYILSPTIFPILAQIPNGVGGELQLTDAIAELIKREKVYAHLLQGERYDCGSRVGFFRATLHYAKQDPELLNELRALSRTLLDVV